MEDFHDIWDTFKISKLDTLPYEKKSNFILIYPYYLCSKTANVVLFLPGSFIL